MAEEQGLTDWGAFLALIKWFGRWFGRALLWIVTSGVKWGFLLLVAVMTGFRLFAPDDYWTSNPGWSYEFPLAFFYAILLAIWLQGRGVWGIAAWPLAFVFMAVAYVSYLEWWRSGYWAYRLTIDVETPEGLKSGSSLARVRMSDNDLAYRAFGLSCDLWSEATVVDLGPRGRLIALLPRGNLDPCLVVPHLLTDRKREFTLDDIHRFARLPPKTLTVPPEQRPIMIRFRDDRDPNSAEVVDPAALDHVFGAGVWPRSVSITILDPGYWPFNVWRWPAFLAGVELPKSTIFQSLPPLDQSTRYGINVAPSHDFIFASRFVQPDSIMIHGEQP